MAIQKGKDFREIGIFCRLARNLLPTPCRCICAGPCTQSRHGYQASKGAF